MGKKSKSRYCEAIEDFIAKYIALGLPVSTIAYALEIPAGTIGSWLNRKVSLQKKIATLELEEAEKRLAKTDSHWFLERKFPHFRLDKNINLNATVKKSPEEYTDEELYAMLEAIQANKPAEKPKTPAPKDPEPGKNSKPKVDPKPKPGSPGRPRKEKTADQIRKTKLPEVEAKLATIPPPKLGRPPREKKEDESS